MSVSSSAHMRKAALDRMSRSRLLRKYLASVPSCKHLDLEPTTRVIEVFAPPPRLWLSFASSDSTAGDKDAGHWHFLFPQPPGTGAADSLAGAKTSRLYGRHGNSRLQQGGGSLFLFLRPSNSAAGSDPPPLRFGHCQRHPGVSGSGGLFTEAAVGAIRRILSVNLRAHVIGRDGGDVRTGRGASAGQTTLSRRDCVAPG